MRTGTEAYWETLELTLPRKNSAMPDRPRLPMTMDVQAFSLLTAMILSDGWPTSRRNSFLPLKSCIFPLPFQGRCCRSLSVLHYLGWWWPDLRAQPRVQHCYRVEWHWQQPFPHGMLRPVSLLLPWLSNSFQTHQQGPGSSQTYNHLQVICYSYPYCPYSPFVLGTLLFLPYYEKNFPIRKYMTKVTQ